MSPNFSRGLGGFNAVESVVASFECLQILTVIEDVLPYYYNFFAYKIDS